MKKIDKDALLKQKFWILLGVFALLWLICVSLVVVNAGGPVDEVKKNFDAAKSAVDKFPHPKNDSFLPPWQKYGETFTKHKNEVWKIAWNGDPVKEGEPLPNGQQPWRGQGGMYDWPSDQDHPLNNVLLYPDSPFETRLREWYRTRDAYGKEFAALRDNLQSDPQTKGWPPSGPLGPVVFKGGYETVMKPIDFDSINRTPDAEECWIAQEDFWVKRELLTVVSDAMLMAARLDPVADAPAKEVPPAKEAKDKEDAPAAKEDKPASKEDTPAAKDKAEVPAKDAKDSKYLGRPQVFRNASWEVTLLFDKDDAGKLRISPDSRIKNIHVSHREQTLGNPAVPIDGAFFRLRQGDSNPRTFYFQGEKVPWDKERTLGADRVFSLTSIDPKRPVELEQVFDRGNTPIASIDEIRIPYVSARNANRTLVAAKPERFGKKEAAAAPATATTPGGGVIGMPGGSASLGGAPPPGMFSPGPGGSGAAGGQGGSTTGAQPSTDRTANISIDRDRYLFVTDQSRHLPLALTLTVDQSHLNEILVALANSRLRFQTTQVEFRRQPSVAGATSTTGGGFPLPGGSGAAQGDNTRPSTFAPPGTLVPGGTAAAMATPTFENPNLVELTIYGVASLYERPR